MITRTNVRTGKVTSRPEYNEYNYDCYVSRPEWEAEGNDHDFLCPYNRDYGFVG